MGIEMGGGCCGGCGGQDKDRSDEQELDKSEEIEQETNQAPDVEEK